MDLVEKRWKCESVKGENTSWEPHNRAALEVARDTGLEGRTCQTNINFFQKNINLPEKHKFSRRILICRTNINLPD